MLIIFLYTQGTLCALLKVSYVSNQTFQKSENKIDWFAEVLFQCLFHSVLMVLVPTPVMMSVKLPLVN